MGFKVPSLKTNRKPVDFFTMNEQKKNELKAMLDEESYGTETVNSNSEPTIVENEIPVAVEEENKVIERTQNFFPTQLSIDIPLEELVEAPSDWNFFNMPDEETFKLMIKSIYHQGQLSPALVWKQTDSYNYMILGGHVRFAAIKVLHELYPEDERFTKMKCHVYDGEQIDVNAAKFIIIMNNMTQRAQEAPSVQIKSIIRAMDLQKSIKKETWGEVPGRSSEVVAQTLGISVAKAKRFYKLRNLIPAFIDMLDLGTLVQGTALKLADMEESLQEHILRNEYLTISDGRLARILAAHSVQEIEDIVHSDFRSSMNGISLTYAIPKTFKKFSVAVDREDEAEVKAVILEAIRNHEFKNAMTKTVLEDILK